LLYRLKYQLAEWVQVCYHVMFLSIQLCFYRGDLVSIIDYLIKRFIIFMYLSIILYRGVYIEQPPAGCQSV
jgi:hypothetical protein